MNFTDRQRDALYQVIFNRRDVRNNFLDKPIPGAVLMRILNAAHHAPSVGFMQPWDFILVKQEQTKQKIKQGFDFAHNEAAQQFSGKKQNQYKTLKLEGIMESPLGICITCDPTRNGPVIIGTNAKANMDLYSCVCAIQNLWLAARAENIGVGWVSIIHDEVLRDALNIPANIEIVAYLCLGYVSEFNDKPDLEKQGWLPRRPVSQAIHYEKWPKNEE